MALPLVYAFMAFSVNVVHGGVVQMERSDFMTWDNFEGQNPATLPPTTTEKPDQEGLDWDEEEEYITEPPPGPDMIGQKTIIAIELPHDRFDGVFLRGGYTGSVAFKCEGQASKNLCSIPIRHIVPPGVSASYTDWLTGDNFLDLIGAEEGQGQHENVSALGTPMRKMEPGAAMSRCNSDQTGKQTKTTRDRTKSTFWLVELDMDCGQTYGYFEVKVVGRERETGNLWYEREIEGKTGSNRAVDESCVGGIGGDIPYIAESHIGFCGLANIFYYKKSYCEVNKIIDL